MYVYGLALVVLNLVGLALGEDRPQAPFGSNGLGSSASGPEALIQQWPEHRLRRFLALRGVRDSHLSGDELVSQVRVALYTPITPAFKSPLGSCDELTVDQLVYWAAHFSGRRVNSHGANVFDAPPTQVRSRAKRAAAVQLCKSAYEERVDIHSFEADLKINHGDMYERIQAFEGHRSIFAYELARAEAAPHVFEPDINPALDRAAKHSIYDLRDLLDVFGVGWTEEDSHGRLTELAKAHTALWVGQRP